MLAYTCFQQRYNSVQAARVIKRGGQKSAFVCTSSVITRSHSLANNYRRPIKSFLFVPARDTCCSWPGRRRIPQDTSSGYTSNSQNSSRTTSPSSRPRIFCGHHPLTGNNPAINHDMSGRGKKVGKGLGMGGAKSATAGHSGTPSRAPRNRLSVASLGAVASSASSPVLKSTSRCAACMPLFICVPMGASNSFPHRSIYIHHKSSPGEK